MCEPATLIALGSFAVGTAGAVSGYAADAKDAKRQAQYRADNTVATQQAAIQTYANQALRIDQERDAAIQQKTENSIKATKARGTAIVAAGEAGVSGLSVDALLEDFYTQEGRFDRAVDKNFQMNADYLEAEMDATYAEAQGRINSVPLPQLPDFSSTAIRVAGAGLDAYSGYKTSKIVR